ncbi:MAG: protein-disulfide reductase DsbD domain-containing protein [Hyphomicrobium sp.]
MFWFRIILNCSFILLTFVPPAISEDIQGQWVEGYKNRTRLYSGTVKGEPSVTIYAFIEIEMAKGWKTYWRNPGTAGGIAPEFDFGKSKNIRHVEVLYPVPELFSDSAGDTIGYKERIIFPIAIQQHSKAEPIDLDLTANYGICEKLCVPVEVNLKLNIPPDFLIPASEDALAALLSVPRQKGSLLQGDPRDLTVTQFFSEGSPHILLSARFPGSAEEARIFLDVEGGKYIPIPSQKEIKDEIITFKLDLSDPQILVSLRGSQVRVTMKGQSGQSEDTFVIN